MTTDPVRPRLRGVLHTYAFTVSLIAGPLLVLLAPSASARAAAAIYVVSLAAMLGVSALYHRVPWRPRARAWMRRLDHTTIFLVIAGTYTPFAVVAYESGVGRIVLVVVWAGAVLGAALELLWIGGPRWRSALGYLALGWVAIWFAPELIRTTSAAVVALVVAGGALYTAGAVIYARGRPDPFPTVFGYHEVFHALVVAAAVLHFVAVGLVLGAADSA